MYLLIVEKQRVRSFAALAHNSPLFAIETCSTVLHSIRLGHSAWAVAIAAASCVPYNLKFGTIKVVNNVTN